MALPPQFLDELRARLTLSTLIGRSVKLVRAGREFKACCPFHKENTPSFYVNDDKGFYHCFGCGAHGDAIGFEMQYRNLSFPEAVEKLAGEAGLEVPRESPQAREEERKRASLQDVAEAACRFFESQLRMPPGKGGMDYLRRRGLDDATIAGFRLGWAPAGGVLKGALARQGIEENQLVEAGLLKRRDDGSVVDYFRERVMFPITDRRDRVIAFGGRILTDAQPKYLNSPDTALFHKGSVLYGLAQAREAAGRTGEIIVTEGYMDVIALARAGFPQAVAPLGTALTETQIEALWKLADEPILCFDGDGAGQRAAGRAAERALPLLRPGKSLRFALMPGGQDPDDLLRDSGPQAMRQVLDGARPMLDMVWTRTLEGRAVDTPERRAAFEADIYDLVGRIADRAVQTLYRQAMRDRLYETFNPRRARSGGAPQGATKGAFGASRGQFGARGGGGARGWQPPLPPQPTLPPQSAQAAEGLRQAILLATLIGHPSLADEVGERLGHLEFTDARLDKLREGVLMVLGLDPALDAGALVDQLRSGGYGEELDSLLNSDVFAHARFARPDADSEDARRGWESAFDMIRRKNLKADGSRIVARIAADPTEEGFAVLRALKKEQRRVDDD